MVSPKPSRIWKRQRPASLRSAMELCLEHARVVHNRSVDIVADLMGIGNRWNLYKWLENGRMPAVLIRPFESACGVDFVTGYLGYSAHKLLIDIPTGKRATQKDINDLQAACTAAIGNLLRFYAGETDAAETDASLFAAMELLGWHRGTVERQRQPDLDFAAESAAGGRGE